MNMQLKIPAKPVRTPAEMALIDAFGERLTRLPGDAAVTVKRDNAVEMLKAGLPTRRVEAWHYTDLRRLLTCGAGARHRQQRQAGRGADRRLDRAAGAERRRRRGATYSTDGVTVQRLEEKLQDGSFAPALELRGADDAVGAINTAFVADGFFVDIAAGVVLDEPIELQNIQDGGQTHVRFPVRVGNGAKATIVERQTGSGAALVSSISHLLLGDDAEIVWVIVQDHAGGRRRISASSTPSSARTRKLTLFVMNAGGRLVRQEIRVTATGEGSVFTLRGVNLLSGETHSDVTMKLDHTAPHTSSTEVIRNIVTDRAHGVFQGRINVHQKAQKTDAKMACNTLLLSDDGEFSTKPELEIFADDVQCGHGATVTEIDSNHLFYLMARGIDEKTARGLLVKAFLAEVIEEMDDEPIVEALEKLLDNWFATHG